MKPVKASKQTTAAASKIKNKILSESVLHSLITFTKQFFVSYSVQLHCTVRVVVLRHFLMQEKMLNHSPTERNTMMPLHVHVRHLLLLQGLFEDQQQGLSSGFASPEGEELAAGEGDCLPSETSRGSIL